MPRDDRRYARKLETLAKRRAKRAAEIAAFSPERKARYDAWCKTHKPGSAAARARARQDREAAKLLAEPSPQPVNPEIVRLQAVLDELRQRNAQLEAELATEGVFD